MRPLDSQHEHAPEQHEYRLPYHWCASAFHRYVVEQAVGRVAHELDGSTILEMGCGDGFVTSLIARHARRVHAFDISGRAVTFARLIVDEPSVSFEVAAARDLSEIAGRLRVPVDVVAAFEAVEHLEADDVEQFLRASLEILAPKGGRLILTTPNGARRRSRRNPHHAHEFSERELVALLRRAGFTGVTITGLYLQPPWTRLEHFANTIPFRAVFRILARAGRQKPAWCRTLICSARAG